MPPYAGFKDLAEYIDQRLLRASANQHRNLTRHRLSRDLGKSAPYIQGLCTGKFVPSPTMARAIAAYFVDSSNAQELAGETHIVGVLAGIESLPPSDEARGLADTIMSLPKKKRDIAVAFVEFLAARK